MARISELHYSDAYAANSGVSEFVEVALSSGESAADFSVAFYNASGRFGLVVSLTDPRVSSSYDPASGETVYVLSADMLPMTLTDPNAEAPFGDRVYEATALVNTADGTVVSFYDIGGGTRNITALDGPAFGAQSQNVPVPTGPAASTYTIQFNQPNPTEITYAPVDAGATGMICFVSGTMIKTPHGERAVEDLAIGDLVLTLDNGARPIRWVGARDVDADGDLAPIHFEAGVLGSDRELLVSPQHRMLVNPPELEMTTGEPEALVAARHLVNGRDVTVRTGGRVTYHHFMFDQHEIVWANGVLAESFFVAAQSLGAMTPEMRHEFSALFPELMERSAGYGALARPAVKRWELAAAALDLAA